MSKQGTFNVKTEYIIKDETQKWKKLKKKLKLLRRLYDEDRIVNEISNEALIRKILKTMDKLEER